MNGKKGEYGMSWQVSAYSFFLFNSRPRKLVSGRVRRQMDGWMTARKCAIELQVQLQDGAGTTAKLLGREEWILRGRVWRGNQGLREAIAIAIATTCPDCTMRRSAGKSSLTTEADCDNEVEIGD